MAISDQVELVQRELFQSLSSHSSHNRNEDILCKLHEWNKIKSKLNKEKKKKSASDLYFLSLSSD